MTKNNFGGWPLFKIILTDECVQHFAGTIDTIGFRKKRTGAQVHATAEFRRVLQILLNLVTNAIRYSPDGTSVTIAIAERGNISAVSVLDQGAGISDKDQEKVFAKFERLGRSGDGGSGLGLYISRRLARFMGGDLSIEPNQQNGAKFTLTLPKE